jgi:hypothetical protein
MPVPCLCLSFSLSLSLSMPLPYSHTPNRYQGTAMWRPWGPVLGLAIQWRLRRESFFHEVCSQMEKANPNQTTIWLQLQLTTISAGWSHHCQLSQPSVKNATGKGLEWVIFYWEDHGKHDPHIWSKAVCNAEDESRRETTQNCDQPIHCTLTTTESFWIRSLSPSAKWFCQLKPDCANPTQNQSVVFPSNYKYPIIHI